MLKGIENVHMKICVLDEIRTIWWKKNWINEKLIKFATQNNDLRLKMQAEIGIVISRGLFINERIIILNWYTAKLN